MIAHSVQEVYLKALSSVAEATPIVIPAGAPTSEIDAMLDIVDGLCFTGSRSNVAPHHYNGMPSRVGTLHDQARDAITLPLIRRAVARQVPLLAICRGLQEVNVACGGTLHQHVHEIDGNLAHHQDLSTTVAQRFAMAHPVTLTEGGCIAAIVGAKQLTVNSVHSQAVNRLADGLIAEATASDGVIEGFRIANGAEFAIALQWHPEWLIELLDDSPSRKLFTAFGQACRRYQSQKRTAA